MRGESITRDPNLSLTVKVGQKGRAAGEREEGLTDCHDDDHHGDEYES